MANDSELPTLYSAADGLAKLRESVRSGTRGWLYDQLIERFGWCRRPADLHATLPE